MRARILLASVVASLLLVAGARAATQAPSTHPLRDPKAPCFRWPAVDMDGDGVFDRIDHCRDTPQGCIVDDHGCPLDSDGDGVCDGIDRCPNTPPGMPVDGRGCSEGAEEMENTQSPPTGAKEIEKPTRQPQPAREPVSESERQLLSTGRLRLENVYFETASAKLLPESEASLDEAGAALEKFPDLEVEVQGHTDTRGRASYNMALSQARAEAVRAYLLAHFHIAPANLVAKGYGETQPETRERNEEELLRNRRVVLRVLNPDALPKGVELEKK